MERTHPLTTAPAGRLVRGLLLLGVAMAGGVLGGLIAALAGVLLQPSFTELEQSAIRLVPDGWDAQPPVELVEPLGAFDRAYRVDVAADDLEATAVRSRAQRLGWAPAGDDGAAELERDGVRARIVLGRDDGAITTSIAPVVRDAQRLGITAGVLLGALAGAWWLWRRWRRHPRMRVVCGSSAAV